MLLFKHSKFEITEKITQVGDHCSVDLQTFRRFRKLFGYKEVGLNIITSKVSQFRRKSVNKH